MKKGTRERIEVGARVCSALDAEGVLTALSGGAVVSIYTDNRYESMDLDFVVLGLARQSTVERALAKIGFSRGKGRHFESDQTELFIEVLTGPVGVGEKVVTNFHERPASEGSLRMLRPTECVMDRLTASYHDNDPQGLEQALMVALRHPYDDVAVREWSLSEGGGGTYGKSVAEKYGTFAARYAAAVRSKSLSEAVSAYKKSYGERFPTKSRPRTLDKSDEGQQVTVDGRARMLGHLLALVRSGEGRPLVCPQELLPEAVERGTVLTVRQGRLRQ